jgi:hypothetical protein
VYNWYAVTAAVHRRPEAVIPRVMRMTGFCSECMLNTNLNEEEPMQSKNYGRDATCPAEEDNRTEEQAGAACGELPCTHSTPGAADGAGQAEDRNAASVTGPAVPGNIPELEWMQKHVRASKKGRWWEPGVFHKTELHDRPSSIFSTRTAGKKRRAGHLAGDPGFPVPEEMQEFLKSLIGDLNGTAEDLYLQVALVDEHVNELDTMFRKTTRQFERRIAELEERGRWT